MDLSRIADVAQQRLDDKNAARERALVAARRCIRCSANAIRAVHREDQEGAAALIEEARGHLESGRDAALAEHPDIYFAGFLQDAQKEYAEACLTRAMVTGSELPSPDDLGVDIAPYLNGMAETIGEGRRAALDLVRRGDIEESERILRAMEEMFDVLVAIDFPDAMTRNLRRSTDAARSILERTQGDLSVAVVQRGLRDALDAHMRETGGGLRPD